MAKLSEETLEAGRTCIRNKDLGGLRAWMSANRIMINADTVCSTMAKCFAADATEMALRIFDKTFPNINPTADRVVAVGRLLSVLLMLAGITGGIAYLVALLW